MTTKTEMEVVRAAMRWYSQWWPKLQEYAANGVKPERSLAKACAAHAKEAKKGRKTK